MSTIAVRYFTKSGNTKKVAEAIAHEVGCEALSMPKAIDEKLDLLFLGASVYWGGISSEVKQYIHTLKKDRIRHVVVFSTSALAERGFAQIEKELKSMGLDVIPENFYCRGQFSALHKGRPNEQDLKQAKMFARNVREKYIHE